MVPAPAPAPTRDGELPPRAPVFLRKSGSVKAWSANALSSYGLAAANVGDDLDPPLRQVAHLVARHVRKVVAEKGAKTEGRGLRAGHPRRGLPKPGPALLAGIDLIQNAKAAALQQRTHFGRRCEMARRRIARPRHGKQYLATLALEHIIDGKDAARFERTMRPGVERVLRGDVHRHVDGHGRIEAGWRARERRCISLAKADLVRQPHPTRHLL